MPDEEVVIPMPKSRVFAQVDVFSATPYMGNPVAVVLDGEGLSDTEMQRIATWTNLSETTFVLPPTNSDADYRLRIFTPGGELPFAGHPTLGSAHAWLEHGGQPRDADIIVQENLSGLVRVNRSATGLAFAAPPVDRDGPLEDVLVKDVVRAFGVDRDQIVAHQWVDNGPGWGVVQLPSAKDVLALEPDLSMIPDAMIGAIGMYPEESEYAYEMRTFAPRLGVPEDPVCGSMNASVGQWVINSGIAPARFRVSQGQKVGRAGDIAIHADDDGQVWVGGATTTCIRGEITA